MKLNRICFLDADTFGTDFDFGEINQLAPLTVYPHTCQNELAGRISGYEAVITNKVVLSERVLLNSPDLKLICVAATGTNNVDLEAASTMGIQVCNAVGYSTDSVAQHCLAVCLELIHKNRLRDEQSRLDWPKSKVFSLVGSNFSELSSKCWGILGLGAIGCRVAELASAFGSEVIYHSVSGQTTSSKFRSVSFDELLKLSDVLSIHTSLRHNTKHLFNEAAFEKLKSEVIFLNMARGDICDPVALLEWIKKGQYLGIGLDVIDQEPPSQSHSLLGFRDPRIVLTPHMAWTSIQSRQRLLQQIIDNIRSFVEGNLKNRVTI